eukprot:Nitzschia sp. Nitz4//scaffold352_size16485//3996//5273//NITZ4_008856-RA/size16485-processed-gene-0.8-mRNA-1//-1//CDS//3329548897//6333//frame0
MLDKTRSSNKWDATASLMTVDSCESDVSPSQMSKKEAFKACVKPQSNPLNGHTIRRRSHFRVCSTPPTDSQPDTTATSETSDSSSRHSRRGSRRSGLVPKLRRKIRSWVSLTKKANNLTSDASDDTPLSEDTNTCTPISITTECEDNSDDNASRLRAQIQQMQDNIDRVQRESMNDLLSLREKFDEEKEVVRKTVVKDFWKRHKEETEAKLKEQEYQNQCEIALLELEAKTLQAEIADLAVKIHELQEERDTLHQTSASLKAMFDGLTRWTIKTKQKQTKLLAREEQLRGFVTGVSALAVEPACKEVYRRYMYQIVRAVHEADRFDHTLYEAVLDMVQFCELDLGCDVLHDDNNLFAVEHRFDEDTGSDEEWNDTTVQMDNHSCACSSITNTQYGEWEDESMNDEAEMIATLEVFKKMWEEAGRP